MNTIKDLRDIIRAGGSTEGENGSNGIDNLQVFTEEDTGKQTLYPSVDALPDSGASISFNNETGKVTVTVPSKWQDDEEVKQYTDSNILKTISSNYKANKNVTYKDPYDESKQIKTDEWISRYNDALRFRIDTLNAYTPTIKQLIEKHGGTDAKNAAIKKMGTKDIIIMSLDYKKDDSLVPLPKYMVIAYPELKELSSFSSNAYGDFVSRKDFLDNFYNIESGKIDEKLAYGIATAPKKVLESVEDMDASEIAKTIGFGNFIKDVDPKRSNWDQFLQAGSALHYGFKAGLYDWAVDTSNLIANAVNFSWLNGNSVDTRDFFDGMFGSREGMEYVNPSEELTRYMEQMAATNKDALTKAQVGYVEGKLAGTAVDLVVSSMFMTDVSNAVMRQLIKSGSTSIASKMAEAANAATSNNTGYTYGSLSPRVYSQTEKLSDYQKIYKTLYDVSTRGDRYKAFFGMTLKDAFNTYNNLTKGTAASLNVLGTAQLANIVNSAAEIANGLKWANTAMSVLGSVVVSAVVSNKELTTKVLSSDATSDEAKSWVSNIIFDAAKMQVWGYALGFTTDLVKSTDLYPGLRELRQKASQKVMKFTEGISNPWVNFMKWFLNNKAAKARAAGKAMSNSNVAAREAVKDAVITNEAMAYGSNLSVKPGSNGMKLIEQYLKDNPYIKRGATISETMQNIANAGIAIDPETMGLSEFEAWEADFVEMQNYLTYSRDFQQKLSIVVKELNNKDIEPIISAQLSQYNKSNAKLLRAEEKAGLITKEEYNISNKALKKEGGINAMHSKEASVYAVRLYEFRVLANKAKEKGLDPLSHLDEDNEVANAFARLNEAASKLPQNIQLIISDEILPELSSVERLIVDRMMNDGVYSRELVESARNSGEYGKDGSEWVRLVARKDMSKGVYIPFDKTVDEDHTVAYGRFKILDDDDITWVGNGLAALEIEYASKLDKRGYEAMKRATNQTTDIVIPGKTTAAMRKVKEYESDLKSAIKQGISSFVETSKGTVAIGKTRARMQSEFYEKVSVTGAISSMDIDTLRNVLKEKGVPLSESITDQESFEKYYDECDQYAKALIDDVVGSRGNEFKTDVITHFGQNVSEFDRLVEFRNTTKSGIETLKRERQDLLDIRAAKERDGEPLEDVDRAISNLDNKIASDKEDLVKIENRMMDENNWPEFWKKSSKRTKEMIREQLKSTSLQTGYGIKGQTLERLNAMVPGFNILDWSLLYREHTNGLVKGGLYSGMDNIDVQAYIMDIDDLIKMLGPNYDESAIEATSPEIRKRLADMAPKFTNSYNNNAVLPARMKDDGEGWFKLVMPNDKTRINDSLWPIYLSDLKKKGIKKVPIVISFDKAYEGRDFDGIVDKFIERFMERSAPDARNITNELLEAFESDGNIPFFHAQGSGYGSMEFNDSSAVPEGDARYSANNGIGDAYWLSPNSQYTDVYGSTKLAGKIPKKYFMSDKEMSAALEDVNNKLVEYSLKAEELGKKEIEAKVNGPAKEIGKTRISKDDFNEGGLARMGFFSGKTGGKEIYYDLSGTIYKVEDALGGETTGVKYMVPTDTKVNITDKVRKKAADVLAKNGGSLYYGLKKLSKKEQSDFEKLKRIISGGDGGKVSYRALAEYTKKPVIDISIPMQSMPGVRADGTAFFYYKGVSPKFDEEIGNQLAIQKSGVTTIDDSEAQLTKYLAEVNNISADELLEDIYYGNNSSWPNDRWSDVLEAERQNIKLTDDELNEEFHTILDEIRPKYPNTAEVLDILWTQNGPTTDLDKLKITPSLAAGSDENPEVRHMISGLIRENDLAKVDYIEPSEEGVAAWGAIDPRSDNIPNSPVFKAPKGDVVYGDVNASMEVSDTDFRRELFRSIDSERFNKLIDFRDKSSDKYELLLEKLDRANAANNEEVKNSMPVQTAAEQYKETVKDLENTVVLTNKLSYLTKPPVPKGSLQEFAENNKISYGKNVKEDVKNALWEKLLKGEEIPEIKGLHIKNIQKDVAARSEIEKAQVPPAKAAEGEIESLENAVKSKEEELADYSPKTDSKEVIPKLSYDDRKELAQKVADNNSDYAVLYRVQIGSPDKFRPNKRGKDGRFSAPGVPHLEGAVWLTSDPEWAESPSGASAGIPDKTPKEDVDIVVFPVKKSYIENVIYKGGDEVGKGYRDKLKEKGKKIVQTRGGETDKALSQKRNHLLMHDDDLTTLDSTDPNVWPKSEFILWEQDAGDVLDEGMELMLEEYNKQYDTSSAKKLQESIKRDLSEIKQELERVKAADEAAKNAVIPSEEVQKINEAFYKDLKKRFFDALDKTDLFKSPSGPNVHKYEIDREMMLNDINEAIDDMVSRIRMDGKAMAALRGIAEYYGVRLSDERIDFTIIGEVLSKDGGKYFNDTLDKLAEDIFDGLVSRNSVVIIGNMKNIKSDIKKIIMEALEFRFGLAKGALESRGEPTFNETSTELLQKYASDIKKAKEDELVVKTTDENGEYQWERVSPSIAGIYNEKPIYTPMSTAMQIWANLSLLKKISTTDLRLGSVSKQFVSDPTMSFITVGALPGTLNALRNEIVYTYGESMLQALEKSDPIRYANIQEIAKRDNISEKAALRKNISAIEKVQLPFTYLNAEVLRQFSTSKYGNEVSLELQRKTNGQKVNSFLRKIADKFGFIQNTREQYFRLIAGEKARLDALKLGYNVYQANAFAEYAINTATTNFRLKLMMFNKLRSTVPYVTAGISGAKSFWRMFMLDPIGVSSRIYTGFICPIMYFMGDIFVNRELREKYKTLSEQEKENHMIIAVGGELMSVPVGEEMGNIVNIVRHVVENMYDMGSHEFWKLMLNDSIGLLPGLDLTGFTDPEMMDAVTSGTASVADLLESGAGKVLAGTTPPLVQTIFMINTGRDLYTGNKINNSYWSIDDEGRAVRMSSSTSQFAQAMAKYIGGDAKVIEKSVSGTLGIVPLILLDSITAAVEYFVPGGEEGSLTTIIDKAMSDISKPFTYYGYDDLDKQWNFSKNELFDKKRKIEERGDYKEYNENIAKEKDPEERRKMINNRNELFHDYFEQVRKIIDNYKKIGGTLDKNKFSQAVSLLTFEDAVRADRQFMDINTDYYDARDKAIQTLYEMGITNPEGPSSLGYIYTDSQGKAQLKMWNPVQMQIIEDEYYAQGDLHSACIKALINDGTENSISNLAKKESEAEDPYWEKFYANGRKLPDSDWDKIDELRKELNAKVIVALQNYMNAYGAANVLSNSSVIDYLDGIIKVPASYEKINGRYISSGNGKLNKTRGFAPSYIKSIFGVK